MSFADYLEKMLIKRGFWSDGDGCWKEINENAFKYLSGIMKMTTEQEEILKKYIVLKLLIEY